MQHRLDIDRIAVADGSRGFQPAVLAGYVSVPRSGTGVRTRGEGISTPEKSPGKMPHAAGFLRRYATRNSQVCQPWVETHGYRPGSLRDRVSRNANAKLARIGLHPGRGSILTFAILTTLTAPASACRYNIREIGFVDVDQPKFRLAVFVHGGEQSEWLPAFQDSANRILGPSNMGWEVIDEVRQADSPDLIHRAKLGPRLPGGMVLAPGRDDGWPLFLRLPPDELDARLATLVSSAARTQILDAAIESYGAVLLLRSHDETANAAARVAAGDAIKAIESSLADLPKRIEHGPRLIECDPSLPDEQIVAWSLGANGKDLSMPVAAVVYGRGRLAGPALTGESLTAAQMREQLSIIGADCECTLDHAWMSAGSLPLAISAAGEARIAAALGFDPSSAPVKAEVHRILLTQTRIAADPAARSGTGYRETPLEIVPIAPGLSPAVVPAPPPAESSVATWRIAIAVAIAITVIAWAALRAARKRLRE